MADERQGARPPAVRMPTCPAACVQVTASVHDARTRTHRNGPRPGNVERCHRALRAHLHRRTMRRHPLGTRGNTGDAGGRRGTQGDAGGAAGTERPALCLSCAPRARLRPHHTVSAGPPGRQRNGTFFGALFPPRRCMSCERPGANEGGATLAPTEPARPTATSAQKATDVRIEM